MTESTQVYPCVVWTVFAGDERTYLAFLGYMAAPHTSLAETAFRLVYG